MPVVKTDEKGRVQLTKEIRKTLNIKPGDRLVVKFADEDKMILEKIQTEKIMEKDPFLWSLEHPAKIKNKKIKKLIKKHGFKKLLEIWKEEQWSGR